MSATERWRRIEELCHAALERDPAARSAFVAISCGSDHALRTEVESLLAHAQTAEGFLAMPMEELAAQALAGDRTASLMGRQLGVYRIVSRLGSGGMGEVYRARDTKLNRDVAIKVLLPAVANDPDRLVRFSREAQVLASLNHPNIAAIYGLEDTGDLRALVMELVEGPTLADRIARGPIPFRQGLPMAKQIAEALEAAHEQGIVHRDLKPANIKVREDGTVKVLDFGLAKATEPTGGTDANSPTLSLHATKAGLILGTAAYMSPEQVRGNPVDKRADIWAFGAVLFEMLTGRRAFDADDTSGILVSVLTKEPDWTVLPGSTPAAIRVLLRRCLEKEPKRRLQAIGDARLELETGSVPDSELAPSPVPRTRLVALGSAVLVGAIAFAVAWMLGTRDRGIVDAVRLTATLPPGVTIPVDTYNVVAIARDGARAAVVGASGGVTRIYVRTLRDFEAHPLPGTEGAAEPFFSPDSAWIGFFANGSLKKTPSEGGVVVTIAAAQTVRGAVWTDADTIVYAENATSALGSVPASGGPPHGVTTLDPQQHERTHRLPSILPGGKTVLFNVGTLANPEAYDDATIEAVRLDTGERKVLLRGGRMPAYAANGDLLYVRGTVLFAVAFDARRLELRGRPRPVIDGVLGDPTTGAAFYSVSDSGTLLYIPGNSSSAARRLGWVDLDGKTTPIDLPPALYTEPHPSPDGSQLAFSVIVEASRNRDVWVADPMRGTSFRLTSHGTNWTPIWSPDGRRVFSVSYDGEKNRSSFDVRAADGTGESSQIGAFDGTAFLGGITPDGATLFLSAKPTNDVRYRIYRLGSAGNPDSRPTEVPFQTQSAATFNVTVSPDGRWLAHTGGGIGIFVQSVEPGRAPVLVAEGGSDPIWRPDGRELYFIQNDEVFALSLQPGLALAPGRPRRLSILALPSAVESGQNYNVDPKSGRLLMMQAVTQPSSMGDVRVILNWFADIRRSTR